MRIDDTDQHIIALLREDGRASFAHIGAQVGLTAPAVKRRVDRLCADGVIQGFTAVVEPSTLGWQTEAFVEVTLGERTHARELRHICEPFPEIIEAYMITGEPDALLHILTRDMAHLEQVLLELRRHRAIQGTKSSMAFSRVLHREIQRGTGIRSDVL